MRATALIATVTLLAFVSGAAAKPDAVAPGRNGVILFSADRVAGPANLLNAEIFAVGRDGAGTANLTSTQETGELAAALSSDGARLVFLRPKGANVLELVFAAPDGRQATVRATVPGERTYGLLEWSPGSDSVAVAAFSPTTGRSTMYVVGLDGARRVVVPPSTRLIRGLSWSPNGGRLAYTLEGAGVYVVASDGTGRRRLAATADGGGIIGPSWSPTGAWIAYVTETSLSLISPDGARPRVLARGVTFNRPAWAPKGASVAIPVRGGLLLARPDGRKRTITVAGALRSLAWSPDGKAIAAVHGPFFNLHETVVVLEPATGRVVTVAHQRKADVIGTPSWSADGRTLVYVSEVWTADHELVSVRPDGTGLQVLTHNDVDDTLPAASPDGSTIAFVRGGRDGGIFLIDADGGNRRRVTHGGTDPAWSPDGAQLAFARIDASKPARTHVYVRTLASAAERRLPGPPARISYTQAADGAAVGYTSHPTWAPDGREVAFAATVAGTTDVFAMRPNGTGLRRITQHVRSQDHFWPEWSSHGQLAYVTGDFSDKPALWITFGGRTWQDIYPSFSTTPAWAPDGSQIAVGGVGPLLAAVTVSLRGASHALGPTHVFAPDWQPLCALAGTPAPDRLEGGSAAELICGFGAGDVLSGGAGSDRLLGGDGDDTIDSRDGSLDLVGCGPGTDTVEADPADRVAVDCESVTRP